MPTHRRRTPSLNISMPLPQDRAEFTTWYSNSWPLVLSTLPCSANHRRLSYCMFFFVDLFVHLMFSLSATPSVKVLGARSSLSTKILYLSVDFFFSLLRTLFQTYDISPGNLRCSKFIHATSTSGASVHDFWRLG